MLKPKKKKQKQKKKMKKKNQDRNNKGKVEQKQHKEHWQGRVLETGTGQDRKGKGREGFKNRGTDQGQFQF